MKKMNDGAISVFALLSMMFFLIFIMVLYNTVMQKGKTQVETEEILVNYYKSVQTANEISSSKYGGEVRSSTVNNCLKDSTQQNLVISGNNEDKYVYSNGKIYIIK